MKHPGTIPSPYATVRVSYGSEFKHLYSTSEWNEDLTFHKSRDAAEEFARKEIEDDPKSIIALLRVEELMAATATVVSVARADAASTREEA